jgi:hypothetical protein
MVRDRNLMKACAKTTGVNLRGIHNELLAFRVLDGIACGLGGEASAAVCPGSVGFVVVLSLRRHFRVVRRVDA